LVYSQKKSSYIAQKVHGISYESVLKAPRFDIVWKNLVDWIDSFEGKPLIVAHNATFDKRLLTQTLFTIDQDIPKNWNFVDSYTLLKSTYPYLESYSLESLSEHFHVSTPKHKAISDATCLKEVLLKVFKSHQDAHNQLVKKIKNK
jgi:DNA polymerase III epsilon subunit-like protein